MKKILACLLIVIFGYGFTYTTKVCKKQRHCQTVKKTASLKETKIVETAEDKEVFHPLMLLSISFK